MLNIYNEEMKHIIYLGTSLKDIASFPAKARQRIAMALSIVSAGLDLSPKEFKYIPSVGMGCYELRLKIDKQYRVFYVAKFKEAIYVLHAFTKKTAQTKKADIDLGSSRYKTLLSFRREEKYDKKN